MARRGIPESGCPSCLARALAGRVLAVARHRSKAAVFADLGCARILLGRREGHRLNVEAEVVDGLLDEVGVAVADVLEVG